MTESKDMIGFEQIRDKVLHNAQVMAMRLSNQDVKLTLRARGQSYELSTSYAEGHTGEAEALGQKVRDYIENGYDEVDNTYYRYDRERKTLVIDYQEIVRDFADTILATHQFFVARDPGKSMSAMIDDRLNFLQSIPYDDLKNDSFGMNTPIRMLAERRGDCESKQVYMIGLLKALYPAKQAFLVVLPDREHIVSAIEMPEAPESMTYYRNGKRYLIVDATGPGYVDVADTLRLREKWDFDYGKQIWYPISL